MKNPLSNHQNVSLALPLKPFGDNPQKRVKHSASYVAHIHYALEDSNNTDLVDFCRNSECQCASPHKSYAGTWFAFLQSIYQDRQKYYK
uniref:hypothetical protein n=1 Tax=Ornithobacterium rhinotracheale TaxID=28251 RepID=UPI00129CC47D|nr:hypothetical protein [Ornithobacterium rhinotracheale]